MGNQTTESRLYHDVKKHWVEAKQNRPTFEELFDRLYQLQSHFRSMADVIEGIVHRERMYHSYNSLYNSLKNDKKLKK